MPASFSYFKNIYERKINFMINKITTSLNIVVRKICYVIIVSLYYIFGLHFPEALKPMVIFFIIKPYAPVNIHKNVKQQWGWVEKSVVYQKSVYMFWILCNFLCAEIVDCSFELGPFEKGIQ